MTYILILINNLYWQTKTTSKKKKIWEIIHPCRHPGVCTTTGCQNAQILCQVMLLFSCLSWIRRFYQRRGGKSQATLRLRSGFLTPKKTQKWVKFDVTAGFGECWLLAELFFSWYKQRSVSIWVNEWMNEWMNESLEWYLVEFHLIYIYVYFIFWGGKSRKETSKHVWIHFGFHMKRLNMGHFHSGSTVAERFPLHPPWSQMDAQWPQTPTFTQIQRTQASGRWTPRRKRITPLKTNSSPLKIDGWKMTFSFQNGPSSGFSGGKQLMPFPVLFQTSMFNVMTYGEFFAAQCWFSFGYPSKYTTCEISQ